MREMMNAIFFVLRGGCPWRMLPEHFPPHQTVYRWFTRFRDDRTWARLNHLLVMQDRERVVRPAPARRSSTAKASRPPKQVVPGDMMPARRSTGASVTPWSTRMAGA
jgi:transposase